MISAAESSAVRKAAVRLVPLLALLYFVSFLDRVNVGFGALTMNADLGLSPRDYGLGAGIFFAGYIAFAVPANFCLRRFGASRWIAGIAIVWGIISLGMAFVQTPTEFFAVRFLLGVAESGFLPGVIHYLTTWFPGSMQGRVVANFFVAVPLSNVLGAPLSGALLTHPVMGLHGWQVMFLVEALPAILLGLAALVLLPDTPKDARWLTGAEARALQAASDLRAGLTQAKSALQGLATAPVWGLGLVYFLNVMALYGFAFWAPQIFVSLDALTPQQVGWLTAIPYLGAAASMYLWSRHSDLSGERVWHVVLPGIVGALGFLLAGFSDSLVAVTAAFVVATVGIYAALGVFWTLPQQFLSGAAAAAGIALINSMGNAAGYLGPYMMGWLKASTGRYQVGIYVMSVSMAGGAALAWQVGLYIRNRWPRRPSLTAP